MRLKKMITPTELVDELNQLGEDLNKAQRVFCQAKVSNTRLDKIKKIKLAQIISITGGTSYADKERKALITNEWIDWNSSLTESECRLIEATSDRDIKDTLHQDCVMKISLLKNEIRTFGG